MSEVTLYAGTNPSVFRHYFLVLPTCTVDYDPFIKSQLVSCNQLKGLIWCKFGHVTVKNRPNKPLEVHRVEMRKALF